VKKFGTVKSGFGFFSVATPDVFVFTPATPDVFFFPASGGTPVIFFFGGENLSDTSDLGFFADDLRDFLEGVLGFLAGGYFLISDWRVCLVVGIVLVRVGDVYTVGLVNVVLTCLVKYECIGYNGGGDILLKVGDVYIGGEYIVVVLFD
jgi:hypothetical protein